MTVALTSKPTGALAPDFAVDYDDLAQKIARTVETAVETGPGLPVGWVIFRGHWSFVGIRFPAAAAITYPGRTVDARKSAELVEVIKAAEEGLIENFFVFGEVNFRLYHTAWVVGYDPRP